ncbi:MAG: primosomal protein N' [Pseudopedobacter saltans]|uniref:Replication restart protein PriA n=1 Tax=Pseudopedobacter saltans TaxID=151895 RepID=A0A2W5GZC0_9SPHI|nr:MAG: primosomal protein N' [Pseudopedobacter saltans]
MQKAGFKELSNTFSITYAEIIVPLHLPQNYTWVIPEKWLSKITPGIRVEVSIRNKKYTGIVKRLFHEKPVGFQPLPILGVIDDEPLLHEQQLALWRWISAYYMCSEGDIMQAAIPANMKLSSETILLWNDNFDDEDLSYLSDEEFIVAEALSIKKELKFTEIQKLLDATRIYPIVKKLMDQHIGFVWEDLKEKYKEKRENFVFLQAQYQEEKHLQDLFENLGKAPKQMELLLAFIHLQKTEGLVKQPDLLKKANASHAQLKSLVDKGVLLTEKRVVDRFPSIDFLPKIDIQLSSAQQVTFDSINASFETQNVTLLHGVTSSGKTEIYIKLIDRYLQLGKQVLYMLPEIALTAQIINRLRKHFGNSIVIYHSKFNANERVEIWNKVKSGEAKIVLGARSSILLPFKDLGLIVVDEEHDSSYKQTEPAPRYHARDTAIYYVSLFGAKVLLGSATPSLESYYNSLQGKYGLVQLSERFGQVQMPNIEIVDIKLFPKEKEENIIVYPPLKNKIDEVLRLKQQVILFQNRRGYSPYVQCAACGWIPECGNCNVSLTWHKSKNKLSCHYCGSEYPVVHTCPACGSHHFIQKNFGTEQIEEIVEETFPKAEVARMDLDSIRGKHGHEALIGHFENKKIDILVGTQMVVKGLDFENVQLVGILDADSILGFTDFRVNERAFQLMEQVSGRAGRRDGQGEVMIQVRNTQHPVLQFVKEHDYEKMYQFEIENRRLFAYPPFTRIINIQIKHKDRKTAEEAAKMLVQSLAINYMEYLSGPAEPVVNRIRNQYLWDVMLKLPKDTALINQCKNKIMTTAGGIQSMKQFRSVMILPDVDPI